MSLCMNCMQEKGDSEKCPHCGYIKNEDDGQFTAYLKENTLLKDRFVIGRVLGQGGFGITYVGYDTFLSQKIAIKEYYPADIAQRVPGASTVSAYTSSGSAENYSHGKEKFIEEARTLAKFADHPGIVGIRDCIEANGTAYIIMQYLDGMTLKDYIKRQGGRIQPEAAVSILMPVMDALRAVHKVGIIHRDISPDNILITKNNLVKLLDFGAARQSLGGGKSLSVMLKPGYAPEEQYRTNGNQGPWTDVYALCATLYKMITGAVPPDSLDRLIEDTLVIPQNLPHNIRAALEKGLAVRPSERFESVDELQNVLLGRAQMSEAPQQRRAPIENTRSNKEIKPPKKQKNKVKKTGNDSNSTLLKIITAALVCLVVFVTAAAVLIYKNISDNRDNNIISNNTDREMPSVTAAPAPTQAPTQAPTPTPVTGAQAVTNSDIAEFAEDSLRAFTRGISNKSSAYVEEYFGGNAVSEEYNSYSVITKTVDSEEILYLDCNSVNRLSDNEATVVRESNIRVYYKDGRVRDISERYRYNVHIYDDGSMKITVLTEL